MLKVSINKFQPFLMIAYHILCHANLAQVAQQLELLYTKDDIYLIDIDNGKTLNIQILDSWIRKPNVHINIDSDIAWGGAGTLRKTILGAYKLLELDKKWTYYVVLSGQCLPIKSTQHIKEYLTELGKNEMNSIRCVAHPTVEIDDIPILNSSDEVKLMSDKGHTKVYTLPGVTTPHHTMAARWRAEIVELGHKSETYWRPCNELLMRRREEFFIEYQYCAGANWFNLHRSIIEYMRSDKFSNELYEVLSTTFIPDESYFQTYIYNSPFRNKIDMDHLRYIPRYKPPYDVKIIGEEDWDLMLESNALFARKFSEKVDSKFIDTMYEYLKIKDVHRDYA